MPLNGLVLGAAAVVASPALWAAFVDGTVPVDVALTRYLLAVGACWAGLSFLQAWALPAPGCVPRRDAGAAAAAGEGSGAAEAGAPTATFAPLDPSPAAGAAAPDPFAPPGAAGTAGAAGAAGAGDPLAPA